MKTARNIDDFIARYPKETRDILKKIRETIKQEAPDAEEAISYGIPTFRLQGKNLVHFSAFKHHIGFYPTPSAISTFRKELAPYKSAKGSVQFPLDHPIPYGLIKKIVAWRVKEIKS